MFVILLSVVSLILSQSVAVKKHCSQLLIVIITLAFVSQTSHAQQASTEAVIAPVASESIKLPPVEVIENSPEKSTNDICRAFLVNQDIESRYLKIKKNLENDYKQGMPMQIKTDLIRVRVDIDSLTLKLFDIDSSNSQEINHITKLTVDYLEKMIGLLPKAHKIAPDVRDRYVVPFTNINSIKAEHQDCLMQAAIEDVQNKKPAADTEGSSINIYKKLTQELGRLNKNLYALETTDVHRFISLRGKLLSQLEEYNKKKSDGTHLIADIPQILNTVHTEIEKLLPGLQLSENYHSITQ